MATPGKVSDMPLREFTISEFLDGFVDEFEHWIPLVRKPESKGKLLEVGKLLRWVADAERED